MGCSQKYGPLLVIDYGISRHRILRGTANGALFLGTTHMVWESGIGFWGCGFKVQGLSWVAVNELNISY